MTGHSSRLTRDTGEPSAAAQACGAPRSSRPRSSAPGGARARGLAARDRARLRRSRAAPSGLERPGPHQPDLRHALLDHGKDSAGLPGQAGVGGPVPPTVAGDGRQLAQGLQHALLELPPLVVREARASALESLQQHVRLLDVVQHDEATERPVRVARRLQVLAEARGVHVAESPEHARPGDHDRGGESQPSRPGSSHREPVQRPGEREHEGRSEHVDVAVADHVVRLVANPEARGPVDHDEQERGHHETAWIEAPSLAPRDLGAREEQCGEACSAGQGEGRAQRHPRHRTHVGEVAGLRKAAQHEVHDPRGPALGLARRWRWTGDPSIDPDPRQAVVQVDPQPGREPDHQAGSEAEQIRQHEATAHDEESVRDQHREGQGHGVHEEQTEARDQTQDQEPAAPRGAPLAGSEVGVDRGEAQGVALHVRAVGRQRQDRVAGG